jgi:hypothetical protein
MIRIWEGEGMKRAAWAVVLVIVFFPVVTLATGSEILGSLETVTGEVQVGQGDSWVPASAGTQLMDGHVLKTGPASEAEVLFGGNVSVVVPENTSIGVADLLLKTRLEKMKGKVSTPVDRQKVELEVTPTTGVRGTEQTESKAESLKRDHYWNETVK